MTDDRTADPGTRHPYRSSSSRPFLDNANLGVGQAVQLVDELVDLPVGGSDLGFEPGTVGRGFGFGELRVQDEHAVDQVNDAVVPRPFGLVTSGYMDGAGQTHHFRPKNSSPRLDFGQVNRE